jgi:signal peptidase II
MVTERQEATPSSPARERAPVLQRLFLFAVAGTTVLLDQLSKALIESVMPMYTTWAPFPEQAHLFRVTHVSNTGAAFGLFPEGGRLFAVVAVAVIGIIVLYNFALPAGHFTLRLALGLQLGGALGNLIDRLRLGHVTDFLDFGPWPVFNLADAAIVAGVCLLALSVWREERVGAQAERPAELPAPRSAGNQVETEER